MSKADKMFKELGYTKQEGEDDVYYSLNGYEHIIFDKKIKQYSSNDFWGYSEYIDLETHKDIHEKMKEIGWL